MPARVLLQDFTGVPAVVDLAAMRDALSAAAPTLAAPTADASRPGDRSLGAGGQLRLAEAFGSTRCSNSSATASGMRCCVGANRVSQFPRRPTRHRHRPPSESRIPGIGRIPSRWAGLSDTLVGTDSHTTMINGLACWAGSGRIEAEPACWASRFPCCCRRSWASNFTASCRRCTATDLVLTITQMLRKKGVVGKFVEFYGPASAR